MEQIITCINCPVGCRMTVTLTDSGEFESVSGNTCPRGASYARQECTRGTGNPAGCPRIRLRYRCDAQPGMKTRLLFFNCFVL